jgi:hypothetical protein
VFVVFTSLICLCIPLPICSLVFVHQKLYYDTTAVTNEFTPELLITNPLNVLYWRTHDMSEENQIILLISIPYIALSCIKLLCFFMNIKGYFRKCVRILWIAYVMYWSALTVAWIIVIMLWILLGAVLNPIAVLAHSVAVGSSIGFLYQMWTGSLSKMKRLEAKITKMVKDKFDSLLNTGVFQKKFRENLMKKKSNKKMAPRITPNLAFKLCDLNGDDALNFPEFRGLMEGMGLKISESRALTIFASSDKGNSKTLSYNEFLKCWKKLQWLVVEDSLVSLGLNKRNFIIALIGAGISLTGLFSFLFLSVSAFGGAGSFGSTVRSAMALLATKLGDSVGKKSDPDIFKIQDAAKKSLRIFLGTLGESNNHDNNVSTNNNRDSDVLSNDEQKSKPKED